jgi:membrane dipeptidase
MPTALPWFDAHLDLAMLAVSGRDMLGSTQAASTPDFKAGLTLPALVEGTVKLCLGTIFTEPGGTGPEGYPVGDPERAYIVGRAQLEAYLTWRDTNIIALDRFAPLRTTAGLGEIRGGMGVAEAVPLSPAQRLARLPTSPPIHLGILMENADPIRSPQELSWWKDRGLVAVGLCWATPSRYATGNRSAPGEGGLTPAGREMVREMDRLSIIHDASHLSDASFNDLCEATEKLIIASHSNCRAITDPTGLNQRHISDAQIKEIARRGGVIGINLFSLFLRPDCAPADRATIREVIAHIEHVCDLTGSRAHIGLGSDMDGGFSADRLPEGINTPDDYRLIAEALRARNWPDADIAAFAAGNWLRVFG